MTHRRQTAFTLIELLVVISLIVLLLSMLLPAMGAARERGRRLICQSNMHQIGVGLNSYTVENKTWLPWIFLNDQGGRYVYKAPHESFWAFFNTARYKSTSGKLLPLGLAALGSYSGGRGSRMLSTVDVLYCPSEETPLHMRKTYAQGADFGADTTRIAIGYNYNMYRDVSNINRCFYGGPPKWVCYRKYHRIQEMPNDALMAHDIAHDGRYNPAHSKYGTGWNFLRSDGSARWNGATALVDLYYKMYHLGPMPGIGDDWLSKDLWYKMYAQTE